VGYLPGPQDSGLDCQAPVLLVCATCAGRLVLPCRSLRASRCVPCSAKAQRVLRRVAGHRSSSADLPHGYLLTVTAPSFDQHRRWVPGSPGFHGWHSPGCDSAIPDLGTWNASASGLWNVFRGALKRLPGLDHLEYFRGVEVQDGKRRHRDLCPPGCEHRGRGALHFHVIIWSPVPLESSEVHRLAVRSGFGCAGFDLQSIDVDARHLRHVEYVTKYVTKSSDARASVPWRRVVDQVVNEHTGEVEVLLSTDATYRVWSASRSWGITCKQLRELLRSKIARPADAGSTDALVTTAEPHPAARPAPAD
jgi:hypothetical protein